MKAQCSSDEVIDIEHLHAQKVVLQDVDAIVEDEIPLQTGQEYRRCTPRQHGGTPYETEMSIHQGHTTVSMHQVITDTPLRNPGDAP